MKRHSVKCSTCGDELPDGTADCLRCNWGGWTNTPHDNTVNPPDPTIDMHRGIQASMDPSCPKCGSPMYWRDAAGLTGLHPEGAWECSNQRCWNMLTPGNLAPDIIPEDPDTGHSDLTLPNHWSMVHEADYQGWTNWDTWNTKLMMDNDYDLYQYVQKMMETGRWKSPQDVRDWAIEKVLGPHNKQAIEDAREWNEIPEHDRLDHRFEDLKDKSPEAADLVNNLGFGPDVSDDEPTLIDPELVNWDEIWKHLTDEQDANSEYESEDQRLQDQGLSFAMPGHSDETNQMLDAWLKHHGVTDKDQRLPNGASAEHHTKMQVPAEHLPHDPGEWSPETHAEWQQQGYGEPRVRSFGWSTLHDIQKGRANEWQLQRMQEALAGQGYPPEQIQQIMRQKWYLDPNGKGNWEPLEPPPPPQTDPSLDQPGDLTFPSDWQAPGGPGTFSRVIPQDRWWFAPQGPPEGS